MRCLTEMERDPLSVLPRHLWSVAGTRVVTAFGTLFPFMLVQLAVSSPALGSPDAGVGGEYFNSQWTLHLQHHFSTKGGEGGRFSVGARVEWSLGDTCGVGEYVCRDSDSFSESLFVISGAKVDLSLGPTLGPALSAGPSLGYGSLDQHGAGFLPFWTVGASAGLRVWLRERDPALVLEGGLRKGLTPALGPGTPFGGGFVGLSGGMVFELGSEAFSAPYLGGYTILSAVVN